MPREMMLVESVEPTHPTKDYPYAAYPQWAIVREIDFKIEPNGAGPDSLVFYYSRYKHDVDVSTAGAFDALLRAVCLPNFVFDGGPSDPRLPFDTPLSLNCHRLSYVIFKLADRNWQFSQSGQPIRLSAEAYNADLHFNARRVDPQANADPGDPAIIKNGCQVAYLISDGNNGFLRNPYVHPFNFYIDLLLTGVGAGFMGHVMDPDIRHPGGSDEP